MIRVKVSFEPIRFKARARLMRRALRPFGTQAALGLALGLAMTQARHEAPAREVVHMVRTIETTAPAPMPEAPSRLFGVPHVPQTSPTAWQTLGLETYPDGFIEPRRPRTSPKPKPKPKKG